MTIVTLHLSSGEKIVGKTNYTTVEDVELRLPDGSFRTVLRTEIKRVTR